MGCKYPVVPFNAGAAVDCALLPFLRDQMQGIGVENQRRRLRHLHRQRLLHQSSSPVAAAEARPDDDGRRPLDECVDRSALVFRA